TINMTIGANIRKIARQPRYSPKLFMANSLRIWDSFMIQPAKIAISSPPKGSMILLVRKSILSKKPRPGRMCTSSQILKESRLNTPSTQASTPTTDAATTRFKPFSVSHATAGSPIEIDEVRPANNTNTKNRAPKTSPTGTPPTSNGIAANACGKVTNKSPGPSPASKPFVNTTGKIATPDKMDVNTSKAATISTVEAIEIGISLPVFLTLKCFGI